MKRKRLKPIPAAICAALASGLLSAAGVHMTAALLSSSERVLNRAGFAENTITVEEPDFKPDTTLTEEKETFEKTVRIKNTGTTPVYVRTQIAFSDPRAEAASSLKNSTGTFPAGELKNHLPQGWEAEGEYLYYTLPIHPGESSSDLIEAVTTSYEESHRVPYDIYVRSESVQAVLPEQPQRTWKDAWGVMRGQAGTGGTE
ncbi:MAG: hypothetical protein IJ225_00210 [Solobacterium sp.]|nr:hypothetical protein [Solobacterium sp.]